MISKGKLTPNKGNSTSGTTGAIGKSNTFLDAYIYMKNDRYNALYEKNKEILTIENYAMQSKDVNYLYNAFMEQVRILDSVVTKMRNFAFTIRTDVISNINSILPTTNKVTEFQEALSNDSELENFKYLYYKVYPISYINMSSFMNMFSQEYRELLNVDSNSSQTDTLSVGRATNYLIHVMNTYKTVYDGLLAIENITLCTHNKRMFILNYFKERTQITAMVTRDFRTYQFFLKQFRGFYDMAEKIKPVVKHGLIYLNNKEISFTDYLTIYKHFSSMMKYIVDLVGYYDNLFYNKIYAIQSNIEVYNGVMNYTIDAVNKSKPDDKDILQEAYYDGILNSDELDGHSLINGNNQANELLWDDTSDNEDDKIDPDEVSNKPNKIEGVDVTDDVLIKVEQECPINSETSWTQSTGKDDGVCTMRSTIVF